MAALSSFEEALKAGLVGEYKIARYLQEQGLNISPVYPALGGKYEGPRIFTCDGGKLIAPDMMAFNSKVSYWVEAKHKTVLTYYNNSKTWLTGIDSDVYEHYKRLSKITNMKVLLAFLVIGGYEDTNEDKKSEGGLWIQDIKSISDHEDHRWPKPPAKDKMVYWDIALFRRAAQYVNGVIIKNEKLEYGLKVTGEIAQSILEGQECQFCGSYIGNGNGYPVSCESCAIEGVDYEANQDRKTTEPGCRTDSRLSGDG